MDTGKYNLRERGQSLVEMAIITPLLIFIFVGLVEVGWAIRGYLVLLTIDRELTRYAARPDTLWFFPPYGSTHETVGYPLLDAYLVDLLDAGNLGLEPGVNGMMIVSRYTIITNQPCQTIPCQKPCSELTEDDYYTTDDEIIRPSDLITYTYSLGSGYESEINEDTEVTSLIKENNYLNCQKLLRGGIFHATNQNVIAIEMFFDQPQLLGVPFVSNTFSDPIPLRVRTVIRDDDELTTRDLARVCHRMERCE